MRAFPAAAGVLVPAVRSAAPAARLDVLLGPDDGIDGLLQGWTAASRVRILPSEVPLLMIRDGSVVLTGGPDGEATALSPVEPYRAVIGALWAAARPVTGARPEGAPAAVLDLLASGVTDRTGAHRMGISERTYRRLVADLMDRLGARSRFEAGMLATAGGWLEVHRGGG